MLFVSPEWRRLIPASWQVVPDAGRAMLGYLTLHIVETPGAYNALQQISYAGVVFLLAPFSIATGIAMSPAIAAVFPAAVAVLGGQQSARTMHFFVSIFLLLFLAVHVVMICVAGFRKRMRAMITGRAGKHMEGT